MNRFDSTVTDVVAPPPGNGHVAPPDFEKQMKPLRVAWIAGFVLIIITVALVAGLLPRWHQRGALKGQTQELSVPTVSVLTPAPGKALAPVALPAAVKPLIEAPIYARASGYVRKWNVELGAQVQAGQVLAQIDTPELDQELLHARAEVTQCDAALALSKTTAERWAELVKTSSVSDQENAEKQADLALKAANLEAARANVRRLEELKSFGRVTAPFAGTITGRFVDIGDLIKPDTGKELFHLAQTGTLRVFVRTPQPMARAITPGTLAEITIPEMPGRVFTGTVVRTAGAIDAESRTMLTEVELNNDKGEVLSGSFAQVRFAGLKTDSRLTLPSNTLLFRAEGIIVGVVKDDGKVELRRVKLGRDYGAYIEITEGIAAGDRVILNPADSLVEGTLVRVAEAAKP